MIDVGEDKIHNITGNEDPEGENGYNSTFSLTSSLDEGEWLTPRSGSFTPGNDPVPIADEAGWTLGPVWWRANKSRLPPEFEPRTVHPVASRYTD